MVIENISIKPNRMPACSRSSTGMRADMWGIEKEEKIEAASKGKREII